MSSVSSNRVPTLVGASVTALLAVVPDLRYHQIDAGTATAGSLAVNVDFGTGARTIATIDFTETERVPVLVFGDVKAISLVPTGVNASYNVAYVATEV
jgi:hypothetical protein